VEGPYGLGFKSLSGPDRAVAGAQEVQLVAAAATPVVGLHCSFVMSARDIASYVEKQQPLTVAPAAMAALACARQEDDLLFNGAPALGVKGLLNSDAVQSVKLGPWTEVGKAMESLIAAVGKLDDAGFHGPYTLGLTPELYNLLFRRYPQGNQTELEHIQGLVTKGVVKVPAIKKGGVLLASGRPFASIVLGQDVYAGFVGPAGRDYEFVVAESVALRLVAPAAVCVLK
jgi:uncharacterized linocin/CFP29 family protein